MDPQATLERFLDACDALNDLQTTKAEFFRQIARQEAVDALRDLARWIECGGFLPKRPPTFQQGFEAGTEEAEDRQAEIDAGMDF